MSELRIPLADFHDACGNLSLGIHGDPATLVCGATEDSRRVKPGMLFVAVNGQKADGRRFIDDAIRRGAVAVAYQAVEPLAIAVPSLRVAHDYHALGRIAECAYGFPGRDMRLLGVTGTNGKTTTAYLLRDIFRRAGERVGMVGTVCYDLGDSIVPAERTTPSPIELQHYLRHMADAGCTTAILEVSSHALDQGRLGASLLDGAIFTNLSGDHLDYHLTFDAYFAAKRRLFTERLSPTGAAVINVDDKWGRKLANDLRLNGFGHRLVTTALHTRANVQPASVEITIEGLLMRLTWHGVQVSVRSPLTGDYNAHNVLGAISLAFACGLERGPVVRAIHEFAGVPGRLQRIPNDLDLHLFVDYAHTDDALLNVLLALKPLCQNRLWVVFGCGGDRDTSKRPRMAAVAAEHADRVYVTSDNPRTENPLRILDHIIAGLPAGTDYQAIPDRREAIFTAIREAEPGDTILVAGKGHEDYQEINGTKYPFDDATVITEALAARH